MLVRVKRILGCSANKAWEFVLKPETLIYVAGNMAKIIPSRAAFPEKWLEKETYYCKSYVFKFIPFGERAIYMESVDHHKKQIQSRESDVFIKRWDHLIAIQPIDEQHCYYIDEIEIDASYITIVVWAWANWFYRYRQSRWAKLINKVPIL